MASVEYSRTPHAAHYAGMRNRGHDIERWTFAAPVSFVPGRSPRPEGVPHNADFHSGYLREGVQYLTYTRVAPLSPGRCDSPVCDCDEAAS